MTYRIGWRELTYCYLNACMARSGYVLRCGALRGFALAWRWHGVALAGGNWLVGFGLLLVEWRC